MPKQKEKPCYEISYIKVTYDKNGKISTVTVKVESKAQNKRK